jgi:hypothetical protein
MLISGSTAFRGTLLNLTWVVVLASGAAVGCGRSEPQPTAAEPGVQQEKQEAPAAAPAAPVADPAMLAKAAAEVERGYKGTDQAPPTAAKKPQAGKKVWIISPGQIGESASIATLAAKEAGEAVGWKMTLFDSKLDVANFSLGIRQAVAARAESFCTRSTVRWSSKR